MTRAERILWLKDQIDSDKNDPFLPYALGLEYAAEGNLPDALEAMQAALKIDPSYYSAHYQSGQFFEKLGQTGQALIHYRKGGELAKTDGNTKAVSEFNEAIFLLEDE
jgi:tetratricopeptide (TPR) repeat protein